MFNVPKRAASGVVGLRRYGSGQHKTNHALMSETSAGSLDIYRDGAGR
jgi:hypothetical protein